MNLSILTLAVVLVGAPVPVAAADLESTFQSLKDAEAKGDAALVKTLAVETGAMAKAAAAEAAPADADEKQAWTDRVKYAQDVQSYTEYALYAVAVKGPAATTVDLMSTLEEQNPKSKYLPPAPQQNERSGPAEPNKLAPLRFFNRITRI